VGEKESSKWKQHGRATDREDDVRQAAAPVGRVRSGRLLNTTRLLATYLAARAGDVDLIRRRSLDAIDYDDVFHNRRAGEKEVTPWTSVRS
jgi:hypothetical protein